MDQLQSNKPSSVASIPMPARTFTVEFIVGLFAIFTVACSAYLSVGLGGMKILASDQYKLEAEFESVSGLKPGASVEIAGVEVGQVTQINLDGSTAILTLNIDNNVKIHDDDIALIRTKGIIGDRYVKISRGSSDVVLNPGTRITDTESVVDIEDLIGKFIHNFEGSKKE